ncbi:MAG: DHH family phosphoesterase, partial [Solobacterium sp.]|nr:DHH family phosphoesterase [Solobacterium sp.]
MWKVIEQDSTSFEETYEVGPLVGKLLAASDLSSTQIKELLSSDQPLLTSKANCVKECCKRILEARSNREKVFIGGDYDADGICSTAILKDTLDRLNIENGYYIPDRFKEGYGLSVNTVCLAYEKGYTLFITVDNGVKAFEAIHKAKELGVDLIITDHHRIEEKVDVPIVVHPDYM